MAILNVRFTQFVEAESETSSFNYVKKTIIERALRMVGAYDIGKPKIDYAEAERILLSSLVNFSIKGSPIWKRDTESISITASDVVTNNSEVYTCILDHISSSSNEPGVGVLWRTCWVLAGDETDATAWASETNYNSSAQISIDSSILFIFKATLLDLGKQKDLYVYDRANFMNRQERYEIGDPEYLFFEKGIGSNRIFLAPVPETESPDQTINLEVLMRLNTFTSGNVLSDFPPEAEEAIVFMLAEKLAPIYKCELTNFQYILKKNRDLTNDLVDFSGEEQNEAPPEGAFD